MSTENRERGSKGGVLPRLEGLNLKESGSQKGGPSCVNRSRDTDDLLYVAGDIIQNFSPPFVKVLKDEHKGRQCDRCFKAGRGLLRCGGCKLMFYCDKSCQREDWKEAHKLECNSSVFKDGVKVPPGNRNVIVPPETGRQICRMLFLLLAHPRRALKKSEMYDGTSRSFNDLLSHHQAQMKQREGFRGLAQAMALGFKKERDGNKLDASGEKVREEGGAVGECDASDPDFILRLAGIWQTNAFTILNEEESAIIGSGIYVEASYFDHSCRPNAHANLLGFQMEIRAIGRILKGDKPWISYLAGHKPYGLRQMALMERYNFVCECERCVVEKDGDLVCYETLNKLQAEMHSIYNHGEYLKHHASVLEMMRKLYHEYDERVTNRVFLTFGEAGSLRVPRGTLLKLATEARDHILKTFGPTNPDNRKFKQACDAFGIPC